jgi:hypothetical protein
MAGGYGDIWTLEHGNAIRLSAVQMTQRSSRHRITRTVLKS